MLLQCKDCGGKVSSDAAACPHCGAPVVSEAAKRVSKWSDAEFCPGCGGDSLTGGRCADCRRRRILAWGLVAFVALAALFIWNTVQSGPPRADDAGAEKAKAAQQRQVAAEQERRARDTAAREHESSMVEIPYREWLTFTRATVPLLSAFGCFTEAIGPDAIRCGLMYEQRRAPADCVDAMRRWIRRARSDPENCIEAARQMF